MKIAVNEKEIDLDSMTQDDYFLIGRSHSFEAYRNLRKSYYAEKKENLPWDFIGEQPKDE